MATGIPKTTKNSPKSSGYTLEYPNKLPAAEILNGPAADLRCLFKAPSGSNSNKVIYGDNLTILRRLIDDTTYKDKVKLVYIDPPFATGFGFETRNQEHAYSDHLRGAEYLEFLRQRLFLLKEVLAQDGSIYVHLDGNMASPAKVIMDEVFGPNNFRNWITRRKTNPKNYTKKAFGNISDYILFYTKSEKYIWNQQFNALSLELTSNEYRHIDESSNRKYMRVPIHAPGVRNGETGKVWRGMNPPPGKHWQYTPARLDEMDARGEIYWSPNGNPRRKIYLDGNKGIPCQDIWLDFKDAHNQNIKTTGYPTEKNPDLLKRIILASSNEGDFVLDAFGGSGTLADMASQTNRQWLTIDNSLVAIRTTIKRLLSGSERMGDYVKKKVERTPMLNLSLKPRVEFSLYSTTDHDSEEIPESEVSLLRKAFRD